MNRAVIVMDPAEWVEGAEGRLRMDGSSVERVAFMGRQAVVGYRSEFRLRWMATKLHLFTVVLPTDVATGPEMRELIAQSLDYGKREKGRFRGLQSGVAVLPILVGATTEPDARAIAEGPPDPNFLVFARPALVDLGAGRTYSFTGRQVRGAVYTSWLKDRLAAVASTPDTPWMR